MPDRFAPPSPDEPERVPDREFREDTELPSALQATQDGLAVGVRAVHTDLAAGSRTVSEWQDELELQFARWHAAAYLAGGGTLDDAGAGQVIDFVARQLQFLDNFAIEIQDADEWRRGWNARLDQYARSVTVSYRAGESAARAGGSILALPAMPAEGTICGTNCGCEWRIDAVNADDGDYNCTWVRGKDDSCATCLARAAAWAPLRIRNGELQI